MREDRLEQVSVAAQAERAVEAGWEPADWGAILRRRRRRQLAVLGALVALVFVALPLHRWLTDRPFVWTYLLWVVLVLVHLGEVVRSRASARGRSEWAEEARRQIRVEHALREHVSIGLVDREKVTERARLIRAWSPAVFAAVALLGASGPFMVMSSERMSRGEQLGFTAVVIAISAAVLWRTWRRWCLARRWLADPLPHEPADAP